jgi:hypothetical protein
MLDRGSDGLGNERLRGWSSRRLDEMTLRMTGVGVEVTPTGVTNNGCCCSIWSGSSLPPVRKMVRVGDGAKSTSSSPRSFSSTSGGLVPTSMRKGSLSERESPPEGVGGGSDDDGESCSVPTDFCLSRQNFRFFPVTNTIRR